jgi:hypothetical protein
LRKWTVVPRLPGHEPHPVPRASKRRDNVLTRSSASACD